MKDFGHTGRLRPIPSPETVLVESVYKTWTARLIGFMPFHRHLQIRGMAAHGIEERRVIESAESHFLGVSVMGRPSNFVPRAVCAVQSCKGGAEG